MLTIMKFIAIKTFLYKNKPTAAEIVNLHKYKTSDKGSELSTNFVAEKYRK